VHANKLEAFLAHWLADTPAPLASAVRAAWRHFNHLDDRQEPSLSPVPSLPDWRSPDGPWPRASVAASQRLQAQTDLATQLQAFVAPFVTGSG
jgi:hypothetical protein